MRINSRVLTEWQGVFGDIKIPETSKCPSQIKVVAERILTMCTGLGYAIGDYQTMTELDKILMVDYWREYDGMENILKIFKDDKDIDLWFIKSATEPELIRRARQWLVEHQAMIVKESVRERASQAGDKFRVSVKGK